MTTFFEPLAMPLRHIAKRLRDRIGNTTATVPPPSFAFTSAAMSSTEA